MANPQKVYWDSCVFIDWLDIDANRPDRIKLIDPVIRAAKEGNLLIVTSAFTMTEVVRLKGDGGPRNEEDEPKIIEFFKQPYIEIRALDRRIATRARAMCRHKLETGKTLTVADAIHVATAEMLPGVNVIHTFDKKSLMPFSREFGTPPLEIVEPSYSPPVEPKKINTSGQTEMPFDEPQDGKAADGQLTENKESNTKEQKTKGDLGAFLLSRLQRRNSLRPQMSRRLMVGHPTVYLRWPAYRQLG
jgi:predicted nucleic acid-binding protein